MCFWDRICLQGFQFTFHEKGESSGNISIWWKSNSNWLHLGQAAEYGISAWCESHPKWRKCNPAQTTCLRCKLLVCDASIVKSEDWCKKFVPKQHVWKLQQADLCSNFYETFTGKMNDMAGEQVEHIWLRLKQGLLSAREKTCGWTKKGIRRKQTWW